MFRFSLYASIAFFFVFKLFSEQAPTGILFSASSSQTSLPSSSKSINLIDLDGDGDLDLLSESQPGEFFLNGNIGGAFLDAQKLYPQGPITIKISNINEEIGLFRAYDPDDPKSLGNYNFELVSGDGDRSNDNFILTTNGNLKVNANLRSGEHSVRVRVTDASGMFLERAFTFIKENELHGLVLTPYIPPHFAPPISSNTDQDLNSSPTKSMLLVDLDKDGDLDLISEDLAGHFFLYHNHMGNFSRDLLLFPSPTINFEANATLGSPIASVVAIASDNLGAASSISYKLVDESNVSGNQFFTINSEGTLLLNKSPSYGVLKIKVQATNSDGFSVLSTFELESLEPERFTPSLIELNNASLSENLPKGTTVGNLFAHDANAEPSHIFSLAYPDINFEISESGLVTNKKVFDFEYQNSFTITVKVTNQYGKSLEQLIKIEILDVKEDFDKDGVEDHLDSDDDNDGFTDLQEIELGNNAYDNKDFPQFPPDGILISTNTVEENKPIGSVIGYLEASGLNIGVSHNFELVLGGKESLPIQVEQNGSIVVTGLIDYEQQLTVAFKVRATNEFGLYLDEEFVIDVIDVDEVKRAIPRTSHASLLPNNKVELHGALLSNGNSKDLEIGFLVGAKLSLSMDDPDTIKLVAVLNSDDSTFSSSFESQASGKMYFKSYALNEKGLVLGSVRRFLVEEKSGLEEGQYGIWSGSLDPSNGWIISNWFGAIKVYPNGWIFHHELGWLFSSESSRGVWLWREKNGWLWTGADVFPFFFKSQFQNWLYYYAGANGNRYFYDYYSETLYNTETFNHQLSSGI